MNNEELKSMALIIRRFIFNNTASVLFPENIFNRVCKNKCKSVRDVIICKKLIALFSDSEISLTPYSALKLAEEIANNFELILISIENQNYHLIQGNLDN